MSRRGRCRCGAILKFRQGPEGYKMRCPECDSIVRLRVDIQSALAARDQALKCACGATVSFTQGKSPPRCHVCGRSFSLSPPTKPDFHEKAHKETAAFLPDIPDLAEVDSGPALPPLF